MNSASRYDKEAWSASAAQRADDVCDRFEHAWKTSQQPRIEDYVVEAPARECPALLRELLLLELWYRRRNGESPSAGEYRQRFPVHAELVADVFAAGGASVGSQAEEADSFRPSRSASRG